MKDFQSVQPKYDRPKLWDPVGIMKLFFAGTDHKAYQDIAYDALQTQVWWDTVVAWRIFAHREFLLDQAEPRPTLRDLTRLWNSKRLDKRR